MEHGRRGPWLTPLELRLLLLLLLRILRGL